jgi:NADPH:quinone reductase-like Zn-dependent oxidoreductase
MKAIVVTSFGGPEVMKYTDFDIPSIPGIKGSALFPFLP